MIKTGSDFSGVGSLDQALDRLGIEQDKQFACDMDKYARQTYILNFGEPKYYPKDVYDRKIPKESLDLYVTSPPCQGFSMAGKREGSVLFFNSHEFIQKNKPRFFIFENVKGLLSHEGGRTFQTWVDYLGGKTVNGSPVIFPCKESVPYHIFHKVINAKHHGIPQNRERVFIIGIRDDEDFLGFRFPKEEYLDKRLKDVLEDEVDEKYFLSDKMVRGLVSTKHLESDRVNNTIRCGGRGSVTEKHSFDLVKVGYVNQDTQASQVFEDRGTSPNICSGTHGYANGYVKVNSATKQGYEIATKDDCINFSNPNSETRRGRVGKGIAQTLDTGCQQGVLIGAIRGKNPENPKSRKSGLNTEQMLEINKNGTSNALTTVQKDNVVVGPYRIRRLTPLECFRLMDFNPNFKWDVSDTQAYKQAGNSICVGVMAKLIKVLKDNCNL